MRKIIITLVLIACLLAVLIWPYAITGQKNCQLQGLGMSLKLPGNGYLLTRNIDRNGLPIDLYKIFVQRDINQEFQKNDTYLLAKYNGFEIQVDAFQDLGTTTIFDLDRLTPEQLSEITQSFAEQYQGDKVSIYKTANAHYICVEYQNKKLGDSYTTKAYITIKNGKLITIALLCPDKQSTPERESKLQQIVDSIQYISKKQ